MKKNASIDDLSQQLDELFELTDVLVRENQLLKSRLSQAELQAASLEKRLAAARLRIETLISRLPENDGSGLLPEHR
jgi:regulator of replication initiation timing